MDNPPPSASSADVASQARGFVGALLDFRFESFVTPKIIKVIYFLMLLGVAGSALLFLVTSMAGGAMGVVIGLVGAPLMLVIGAVLARVYVEIIMLAFKMLETLQRIEAKPK